MFKGERHSDCSSCWQIEDKGATSLRGSYQNFVSFAESRGMMDEFAGKSMDQISQEVSIDSEILQSHKPFMLEVSLGNTCDLKCMYCNHVYSSQWATEKLKDKTISIETYKAVMKEPEQKFVDLFWKWVDTEAKHSLDRIGIIGGEPLITPEYYDFIDKLFEVYSDVPGNDTTIWIVTNLNTPDAYYNKFINSLPKLTEKFKLEILISMESTGEQAEYIRHGLDWDRFNNNVNRLFTATKDLDRVTVAFLPSITALAVPRFKNFLEWVYELSIRTGKPSMLKQNIVTSPAAHTPFLLPNDCAKYLTEAIEFLESAYGTMPDFADIYGRWDVYRKFLINLRDSIRDSTTDQEVQRRQFYNWFTDFDKKRGTSLTETFPELKEFYIQCGEIR